MDIIERLRNAAFKGPTMEAVHRQDIRWEAADEIEQLREALELVVVYWDEWMDAPDSHTTALSLEEVVSIARAKLGGRD